MKCELLLLNSTKRDAAEVNIYLYFNYMLYEPDVRPSGANELLLAGI